jgi:hypothetical protein
MNPRNDTPKASETELRGQKLDELREAAKQEGISGASRMRKEELVHAVAESRSGERQTGGGGDTGRQGQGQAQDQGQTEGGVRTGPQTSKSLKYSQEISSPDEDQERPGRSLVTTNHDVIRQWAEERGATPAVVPGTEHGDHLGVLTFDFGEKDDRLRHVSWDEWFRTFDERRLNFIYQEKRRDGRQSNFFRLESPEREDA